MFNYKFYTLIILALLLVVAGVAVAQDDGRINLAHHFGGDTLYCTTADGCWMLDMNGQPLWAVSQATIDAANTAACETGQTQVINAGQGTYGAVILQVNCSDGVSQTMTLYAYDEWNKLNSMDFWPSYLQVGGYDPNLCQLTFVYTATGAFAGYGVYNDGGDQLDAAQGDFFVNGLLSDDPGLPRCRF